MAAEAPKRRGRPPGTKKPPEGRGLEIGVWLGVDDRERLTRAQRAGETPASVLRRALRALVGDPETDPEV